MKPRIKEAEWLAANRDQLFYQGVVLSKRKARLALCACARRVLSILRNDSICINLLDLCEKYSEGPKSRGSANWKAVLTAAKPLKDILHSMCRNRSTKKKLAFGYQAIECAAAPFSSGSAGLTFESAEYASAAAKRAVYDEVERSIQVALLRDIFGNPFRPVNFAPEWRTSTVVSLAKSMYDSRDFSPMPILSDALQDAGCEHEDILNHCRAASGVHVRGCWVVDLILEKS